MKNTRRAIRASLLMSLTFPLTSHAQTYTGLGFFANRLGDGSTAFASNYAAFTSTIGQNAYHYDLFVDYTQPISNWASNANYEAGALAGSPLSNCVPVVSVGLVDSPTGLPGGNYNETNSVAMLNAVANGTYDDVFRGVIQGLVNNGYPTFYLRIAWEQNGGGYEPWYATNDSTAATAYVAAWQRVANIAHNVGGMGVAGASIQTVWSPTCVNWTAVSTDSTYPGDSYVDVVGPDLYSPVNPEPDLYDYSTGQTDASATAWAANPVNREHYWDYPGANQWNQTSDQGYGLVHAVNFAVSHNKPFGLSETGAGDKNGEYGPADEGDFPTYLANRLTGAMNQGVQIAFVNVWNEDPGDGNWRFTDGDRPNEAAAWKQFAETMGSYGAPSGSMSIVQGATTGTTMALSWAAVPGAASYTIGYQCSNSQWASVTTSGTSITLTGLAPSTWYWIEGQAANQAGTGPWTSTYSFQTSQAAAPTATMNISQGATTAGSMVLSWAAIPGATSYTIGYQCSSSQWASVTTGGTSLTLTGLAANTWYWIQGQAANSAGTGPWTGTYSFETSAQ